MPDENNPLLLPPSHDIPFDRIRAEHVVPAVEALLEDARARMRALEEQRAPHTYSGTLLALDTLGERLGHAMGIVGHLEAVVTSPELRDAYGKVQAPVSELLSSIPLSDPIWHAVKEYAATDEARALGPIEKRLLTKTVDDFRRAGADLSPDKKKRLMEIDVELTTSTMKFAQNVLDSTNAWELVVENGQSLAGLPESVLEAAKESAAARGLTGYRLTLQSAVYIPAMTYLDDRALREKLYRAYHLRATSGTHDNRALLAKVVALRAEKAKLLGYASFADLVLEDRMAKNGDAARAFVEDLRGRILSRFDAENRELEAFAGGPIEPWDTLYWSEKMRKAKLDVDEEALRPFFPVDSVLDGLFAIASRIYGIRIRAWKDAPLWHPDVRAYAIEDESGAWIASFFLDLFPRETKQEGAWMHGVLNGAAKPDARSVAVVVGNLTPPSGGAPALLRLRDVETIFHEFGHLLHHCLSRVPIKSLAGTNVATDFVELPSKIMENWVWEKPALDLFAKHWKTGALVDDAIFERLRRARTYRAANMLMRQLGFAAVDLALHAASEPAADPMTLARDTFQRFSPTKLPSDYAMLASFTHLFGYPVGYAAGYYSYCWADVLDADAFTRFRAAGIFDRAVGRAFWDELLARGNAAEPMDLYRAFMGREPTIDALLARTGIAA